MKLVNSKYNLSIEFNENESYSLVVENKEYMQDIVENLIRQVKGENGDFILSENKEMNISKNIYFIVEPFTIEFNDRKIMSKLYEKLLLITNDYPEAYNIINTDIVQALEKVTTDSEYSNIEYNFEFDWKGLFKLYNIRIGEDYNSLFEKIQEYIKILVDIMSIKVIVFLNLKEYLSNEQMDAIQSMCQYKKIILFMLESQERDRLSNEKIFIVDKDRCLIVK